MKLYVNLSKFSTRLTDLVGFPSFDLVNSSFVEPLAFSKDSNGFCHPSNIEDYWTPQSFRFRSGDHFYFLFSFDGNTICYRIPFVFLEIFTSDVWFCNIYYSFLNDSYYGK